MPHEKKPFSEMNTDELLAVCASEQSRAVIIEGKNSVTLDHVTITGNDQSTKEGSVRANVLLYQSASGDAGVGTSAFTMTGGKMTALSRRPLGQGRQQRRRLHAERQRPAAGRRHHGGQHLQPGPPPDELQLYRHH